MGVLIGSPSPTTPTPAPSTPTPLPEIERWNYDEHFPGLDSVLWTGWDGSTWELWCRKPHTSMSGVALGRRVRGFHTPDVDTFVSESPGVDGAAYQGYRVKPRDVFLTLRVYQHGGSQEWVEYDRAFARSMLPAQPGLRGPGVLTVVQPDGSSRRLTCYPQHRGDHEFDVDPSRKGWAVYGQSLTAYDPFWVGDPVPARSFEAGGSAGFFGGSANGRGPGFVIGSDATFAAAKITNPGDEPAWPVWTIHGPFTAARIGVPGELTEIVATVAAGDYLRVESDPLAQSVTDSQGRTVYPASLSGAPFVAVPPGDNVPLIAELEGAGRIEVTLQPRWLRAW